MISGMHTLHGIFLRTIVVCLLGVSILTIPLTPLSANTQTSSSSTASKDVADATVNLYCRIKTGKQTLSVTGTGVLIDARGVILTNAHIAQYFLLEKSTGKVTAKCSVRTGSPAKETYTADILYLPLLWIKDNLNEFSKAEPTGTGEKDFALLYITNAKKGALPEVFPFLSFDSMNPHTEGSAVSLMGYPSEGFSYKQIQNKLYFVSASSTITNARSFVRLPSADLITIGSTDVGKAGSSGGPILSMDNDVIAIIANKNMSENNYSVRAITLSYINRALLGETGM